MLRRGITRNDRLYFDLDSIGYPAPMGGAGSKELNEETRRQVEKVRLDVRGLQQEFMEQVQKEGSLTTQDGIKIEQNMEANQLFKELRRLTEEADYLRQQIKGLTIQTKKQQNRDPLGSHAEQQVKPSRRPWLLVAGAVPRGDLVRMPS